MENTLPLHDWLRHLDSEYLSTFIRDGDGGASIKFAVTKDNLRPELYEALEGKCQELDYLVIKLDAAEARVHMPQDIFFGIASQVDWRLLARRLLLRLAEKRGYGIGGIAPGKDAENIFEAIGKANNNLDSQFVLHELRPEIESEVFKEYRMAKDFRVAMTRLCMCENFHPNQEYGGQPLVDWLTGINTKTSSVKSFSINTRINRTTARHFIESALFWFRHAGYAGTVILLDNSRVTLSHNPKDGRRYYTKAMVMDHYEALREFIDGIDQLVGTLLVVVTNSAFLDQDARSRGFGIYPALMTRVMDDVRDKNLVNPIAALVRLS